MLQTRLFLVLFLCISGSRIASADTNPQDAAALRSLMKSWTNLPRSWRKSNDPCGAPWDGIKCNGNSRVTSLNLFGLDIGGTLRGDIGSLTELTMLDLSSNSGLGGPLTPAIGKLIKLQILALIGCNFNGALPDELGNLIQLKFLALNSNQFIGSIPPSLGKLSKLNWLDLADNRLTGGLPTSRDNRYGLDQLLAAEHFHLNQNNLSGSLPEYLFNSSMTLKHILLDYNNFNGSIPVSIGAIKSLEVLRLNDNNFVGSVPANINNPPNLHVLMLANNKLTGPMPNLTGMSALENLDLSNNSFDPSEVPSWFSGLPRIISLTIQSGRLYGQLPQKLFSFSMLQQVILSDNHLNDTLDMGNNISNDLDIVNLRNNNITSLRVYKGFKGNILTLAGNPLCSNSLLSDTEPCLGQQSGAPPVPADNANCANPFVETITFRAPSFGNVFQYIGNLRRSISSTLSSCTPNQLALVPYIGVDGYLNVDLKACPVNKKKFNYSEVLNCFNLTLQTYKPPEIFGPYFVNAHPYPFHDKVSRTVLIAIVVLSVLLVAGLVMIGVYAVQQKKRAQRLVSINNPFASWGSMGEDIGEAPKLSSAKCFSLEELKSSTNDFRQINVFGAGGYGMVYRGKLLDGQIVAIKRSKQGSMQGGLEFKTEIELLSRVHHKNLVGLVGFCFEKEERMLVYEFIRNGTLRETRAAGLSYHFAFSLSFIIVWPLLVEGKKAKNTSAMASLDWSSWICGQEFSIGSLCVQRSLIDCINVVLLIAYVCSLLLACIRNQYVVPRNARRCELVFISVCCAAAAAAYAATGFWHVSDAAAASASFLRGLVWIAIAASLFIQPTRLARTVAVLWGTLFSLLISLYNVEALVRTHRLEVLEAVTWPVNFLLLFCALRWTLRSRGHQDPPDGGLSQPLIDKTGNDSELYRAGLFSQLVFSWLNHLLRLGHSKALDLGDIPLIASEDGAQQASQKFSEAWNSHRQDKSRSGRTNNLVLVLYTCFLREILLAGFYALLRTLSIAVSPALLFAFIWYNYQEKRDLHVGLSLVGCLLLMKLVESLSQRHWFFDSRRTGMRMRSALMAVIFQKQLRLSSQGRRNHSTGEIVNYIAVDAYRLGDAICWFHMAWSLPLQLALSIGILFWALRIGALPGIVPLVIFGVLNVPFAKMLQGYQAKFMVAQDERLRATSEILNSMKIIKLQSWEEKFRRAVESLRDGEFKWLRETQMKKAYGAVMYWMSPTVVSAVMYAGTAILRSAPLNASTLFTVLATLRVMAEPVRMLPEILTMMIQYKVSLDRIEKFLVEDEIKEDDVKRIPSNNSDISIHVRDGNFSWNASTAELTLRNVNLSIHRGEKVAVCGPVGSGKSSLLYALLGEIPRTSGSVVVFSSVAYVSQNSWIQSGTVRDNILFGKPFIKELYEKAIKSCALDKDIENFDHGDLTEIGQRGLNMSGGQKQRIQLARAVYNDADVYLLDDPFSAVDAHTAAVLFYDCVMTALAKKTVVLVTHQVEFLSPTDRILVMEGGQVRQEGKYAELLESGTAFEQLVTAHRSSITTLDTASQQSKVQGQQTSDDNITPSGSQPIRQASDVESSRKGVSAVQLTEEEEKEIGDLGWKPYRDYLDVSKGSFLLSGMVASQVLFTCFQILSTYWLAVAVQMNHISSALLVGAYSGLSIFSCCFAYLRSLFAANLGLKASKAFFTGLMDSVFKAPMSFFDSTPVGRILTRASSDLSILDFDIPYSMAFVVTGGIEVVTTVLVMGTVTWQVLVVAIPVTITMVYVQRYYVTSARELVRINGTTKAPVMNYAAESILGVVTIRAFAATERFIRNNLQLIDIDATLFFHTVAALEWVLIRVEALQSLTILTAALFLILLPPGAISPGFAGLCLSYALTLTSAQVFLTRFYSYLENYIISVERIKQYMHLPSEPPAVIPESRPPMSWPHEGRIDLQDLKVKYRANAPLVLKGITCTFAAGNKIGVVGRTGSGKTTLISVLFRLIDPVGGKILIDKLDIGSIGLKDLRTKLSIIPQEPTLFRGTVRNNLDPLGLHSDQEIWQALEKCQLKSAISSSPAPLDTVVSDDGDNWSVGQRQLFCLGRVLLRRNRILVLDEATASIDSATDAILQKVIRQQFSSCTVITIAHRVPTVTDSDMVMVLSYGKLLEYDTPSKLMEDKQSAFSKLVAEYWANCKRNSM